MILIAPQMKIFISIAPIDFRCGIDALTGVCREKLKVDPFSGAIFVLRNRAATSIKMICYDGTGYWLIQKRFSEGKLRWWPVDAAPLTQLAAKQLQVLIYNGDPSTAQFVDEWRKL